MGFLFGVAVLAFWSMDNREYLDTMNEQIAQGYVWKQIECREPNKELPFISIKTPIGNEYVCNKLMKPE